jgi:CopG family transcriptional regulator / antitoxin EndoAI
MSNSKKLVADLSKTFCQEFNEAFQKECKKSSEFIDDGLIVYIEERKTSSFLEEMKHGYLAMAELNLEVSEFGLEKDIYDLIEYEARL